VAGSCVKRGGAIRRRPVAAIRAGASGEELREEDRSSGRLRAISVARSRRAAPGRHRNAGHIGAVQAGQGSDRLPPLFSGLFAGIGGIELGFHRAGHHTILLCENDPAAIAVLEENFHGIPLPRRRVHAEAAPRRTTLVTAGFPCQDLSQAGMTKGISGARSGLVGEVFDYSNCIGHRGYC